MSDSLLLFRSRHDNHRPGHELTRHFDTLISEINDLHFTLEETWNGCSDVLDSSSIGDSSHVLFDSLHRIKLIL